MLMFIGVLMEKIDGPSKWNKTNLNQGYLVPTKLNYKGHLIMLMLWRVLRAFRKATWFLTDASARKITSDQQCHPADSAWRVVNTILAA